MKTEKEIYEYLWSRLRAFEPKDSDARTEFDWHLTKIAREFRECFNAEEDSWHALYQATEFWWHTRWHADTGIPCDDSEDYCPLRRKKELEERSRGS